MNNLKNNKELIELINELPTDPRELMMPKEYSLREAIIKLGEEFREEFKDKTFTKEALIPLLESAFPYLKEIKSSNLNASIKRAGDCIECVLKDQKHAYKYKFTLI